MGWRGRTAIALLVTGGALVSVPARAEIALLLNGDTLKVDGWRLEGAMAYLELRGGGEIGLDVSEVAAILPDEVPDPQPEAPLQPAPAALPSSTGDPIREIALAASRRHSVDPALVMAVIDVESAFRPEAVSPKGAMGLMQLMPQTAANLGVAEPFDPNANIEGGVRHLRALLDRYQGDQRLALAAYNAGAAAVERHSGVPPYDETRTYVRRVLERRERYP
jgi:soluble lytic murein transglycosylase-like protein